MQDNINNDEIKLEQFYKKICNARKRIAISHYPAWYRGNSHKIYQLLPTILRRKNGLRFERNLYANFVTEGKELFPHKMNSWEILALMQHYGVPTRLLDWTTSLEVALFFAVNSDKPDAPCIWILNPYRLNKISTGKNLIYDEADKLNIDYYESIISEDGWPFELPLAMASPWTNSRIKVQQGKFTFHGNNIGPLEQTCSECVKRIQIHSDIIRIIRKKLKDSGTHDYRLFPDLDGLARSLKRRFKFPM